MLVWIAWDVFGALVASSRAGSGLDCFLLLPKRRRMGITTRIEERKGETETEVQSEVHHTKLVSAPPRTKTTAGGGPEVGEVQAYILSNPHTLFPIRTPSWMSNIPLLGGTN